MYQNFSEVLTKAKNLGPFIISVAVAQDSEVLEAVKLAREIGLANAILVGDAKLLRPLMAEAGLSPETLIIHEPEATKAALTAVSLVKQGKAHIVMKGLINSSDFLRAVLNKEEGLRTGRLLSHLSVFEIPGQGKLLFITDAGMNIAPALQEKKGILINAMLALHGMGMSNPHVAILTANEQVTAKMPATVDAQALVKMSAAGELPPGIVEGPIAFDVAVNPEAAKHKGIHSQVSGKVDLFLVPNIETGNAVAKALVFYAKAKMAGLVLGATNPIVLTSRAETAEGKLNSIALACLAYCEKKA